MWSIEPMHFKEEESLLPKESIASKKMIDISELGRDQTPSNTSAVIPSQSAETGHAVHEHSKHLAEYDELISKGKKHTLKFIIHAWSDITQNLVVFALILVINFILPELKSGLKSISTQVVTNISIWSAVELVFDVGLMFVCLPIYDKIWFKNSSGVIRQKFTRWLQSMRPILIMGFSVLSFFVFYIVFFVALSDDN